VRSRNRENIQFRHFCNITVTLYKVYVLFYSRLRSYDLRLSAANLSATSPINIYSSLTDPQLSSLNLLFPFVGYRLFIPLNKNKLKTQIKFIPISSAVDCD